jgi:DNA-binding SARP family transcriptional activator
VRYNFIMFRLSIRLLGPFEVLIGGRAIHGGAAGFDSDKVRALLAYLAVEANRPHRRQALAGLFWPNSTEKSARANLRRALSNLRKVIGDRQSSNPVLCTTRQTIQFDQGDQVWVDVATFHELLGQELPFDRIAAGADDREQSEIARLAEVVANYGGPFLEGFSLNDNVAFEEWLVLKREQLRHQFLTALHKLAQYYEAQGAYEPAMRYVRRQVEVEPWSEPAQRQLMRLLAYTGQRTAALDQFAVHKRTLAAELGIEPEAATIQLYQQIQTGELARENR